MTTVTFPCPSRSSHNGCEGNHGEQDKGTIELGIDLVKPTRMVEAAKAGK